MTIQTITVQAKKLFNKGDTFDTEQPVPVGVQWVEFGVDRSALLGAESEPDALTVAYQVSLDGGATWPWDLGGSAGFALGILLDGNGQPIVESRVRVTLPNASSSARRMRFHLEVTGDGANVGLFVRTGP